MKLIVAAIYDKMTGYLIPSFHQNEGQAVRAFENDLKSPEMSLIMANPQDFNLQLVGTYDTETGVIEPETIKILCDAGQFVRKEMSNERGKKVQNKVR